MSFFDHARNTLVHGNMSATQDNRTIHNAKVTHVGTQNIYHEAPVKGVFVGSPIFLLF